MKWLGAPKKFEKVMGKYNIECASPIVQISLRIFLTLIFMNCSAEHSLSQLKNPNKITMRQEMLDSLSLLMIAADLLRKINFDDIIKDFSRNKSMKKNYKT